MHAKYKAEQFKDTFKNVSANDLPSLGFVVIQKKINKRVFVLGGITLVNPTRDTVLDHTVTKRNWYDFFLVSQQVGQDTVSPTYYIMVQQHGI